MDDWNYLEREVVTDPKGRTWTVALMDVLGQKGDPDIPNKMLELAVFLGAIFHADLFCQRRAAVGTRPQRVVRGHD